MPKELISTPYGDRIKIIAEVTERATGTKEIAVDNSVKIVKTPFIISFEKTMKYFKPGIVFKVGVLYSIFPFHEKFKKWYLIYEI